MAEIIFDEDTGVRVIRKKGKFLIELDEDGILNAAEYKNVKITDKKVFLDNLAVEVCSAGECGGFDDLLHIHRLIDSMIENMIELDYDGIELIEDEY